MNSWNSNKLEWEITVYYTAQVSTATSKVRLTLMLESIIYDKLIKCKNAGILCNRYNLPLRNNNNLFYNK
jgi:hypothetical protein